ncbi:hypothetical protein [Nonomuraea dietziae]|uniref:Uncharacterized protein n=1 Tax=Nonomuraea dietziae TaxID=65515 RepID=A0A7W5UTB8_9ACTN|nr:hypothetical protein [Nonomuraea dietziae]MBB3724167.1 hypothetical protein [Nonomuraea dietziae]
MFKVSIDEGERAGVMSRRERLRVQTSREIKAIALRQMAEGGPERSHCAASPKRWG